jgi:hypothetical protein
MTCGTDRYGPVQSDMFVSILNVNTLTCPQTPAWLDTTLYYEDRPARRAMAGANFWYDQETIRAMYRLSSMTGDAHYAAGADRAINAFFDNAIRSDTGMPLWGSHQFYNVFTDRPDGDGGAATYHEILLYDAQWSKLYDQRPTETRAVADLIWSRHINPATGQFNRHDTGYVGCDFAFSGGSFISAFASIYNKTQDATYLNRALTVENWHWSHRNTTTNLIPDAPSATGQFEATHCMTSVTGPYVWQLLNAYELTGNDTFRNHAIAYVKAYDHYGWNAGAKTYWGMLNLDGTHVPYDPNASGYYASAPTGDIDIWKGTIFSGEFPLIAAQSAVRAYELTGDPELLTVAEHWADAIRQRLPVQPGYRWGDEQLAAMPDLAATGGSYAEDYGRVISFFVHMYNATDNASYLQLAELVGQDAVDKLYVNGIFRGHAAKPYYESTNGVGVLLDAMLELDAVAAPEPGTLILLGTALLGLAWHAYRKRVRR